MFPPSTPRCHKCRKMLPDDKVVAWGVPWCLGCYFRPDTKADRQRAYDREYRRKRYEKQKRDRANANRD